MKIIVFFIIIVHLTLAFPIVKCKVNRLQSSKSISSYSAENYDKNRRNNNKNINDIRTKETLYSVSALNINNKKKTDNLRAFPCGDELDKRIFTILLPAIVNFAILPLVGAADTFFVGGMRNALALGNHHYHYHHFIILA